MKNRDTRPGYINGRKILGYDEVTMHHIADFASDLWGGHRGIAPNYQKRTGPRGRWRKWKRPVLYGEPYWYMKHHIESGRKILTAHYHRQGEDDDYRW